MSRIVLCLSDPPLPFGDAAARWFYVLLRGLVARGHDVVALAVCGDAGQAAEVGRLFPAPGYDVRLYAPPRRSGPWRKLETLRRPYSYRFGPDLHRDLAAEMARGADVLQLEHLWIGWLGLAHADRAVLNVHYLFDIDLSDRPPDSASDRARRAMTRRAERVLLRRYPNLMTLTPRLSERARQLSPRSAVHTVPLGLDTSLYPFEADGPDGPGPVVGLIGSFRWHPTYWAGVRLLTRLWPEIRGRVPGARLQIVGRRARAALGALADVPGVSVAEDVPDAIPYFRAMDVLLYAPSRGSGMKVKVLEAFALGVPVVTTSEGVEGLPAEDGVHAGVCEDDAGLIERTVALLNDPARRRRQRVAARALLEAHCAPGPTLDRLEQVYASLTTAASRSG
jgi:glycosyltransferase involved in cell wall biosynthesis